VSEICSFSTEKRECASGPLCLSLEWENWRTTTKVKTLRYGRKKRKTGWNEPGGEEPDPEGGD